MKTIILFCLLTILSSIAFSQEIKLAGTHPPNPVVLKLMEKDAEIFD